MSLGLLTEKDDAVVWRGPKKQSTIDQLVNDVNWGELDVLGGVHFYAINLLLDGSFSTSGSWPKPEMGSF